MRVLIVWSVRIFILNLIEKMSRHDGKVLTISVPFGVGVKFNFGQSWILAAEVQPQFTLTDNLDGSYPNSEKKPDSRQIFDKFKHRLACFYRDFNNLRIWKIALLP
jgi:hypothetical protein